MVLDEADEVSFHHVEEDLEQVGPLDELILVENTHLVDLSLLILSHVGEPHLSLIVQCLLGLTLEHRLEDMLEALDDVDLFLYFES